MASARMIQMLPLTRSSRTTLVPEEKRVVAPVVHAALTTRLNIITILFLLVFITIPLGGR